LNNPKPKKNVAAAIRQGLLNLARQRKEDFGLILTKYGLERILFRLSQSKHLDLFILKGALLFELWTEQRYRPTRDADFLATGDNSPERFANIFKEICEQKVEDDGLRFDEKTAKAEAIKEGADYEGVRVTFVGHLGEARIPIQVDIGFGDIVTPGPVETIYPALLDLPRPKLMAYPKESVIAEKFEAIVKLGIANSRMKDFHDVDGLASRFEFKGEVLAEAIRRTFEHRGTQLPADGAPIAFRAEFYADENKIRQWNAFCSKNKLYVQQRELKQVIGEIRAFLAPLATAIQRGESFNAVWKPGHRWE
jgi:hypothetical protein